MRRVGWLAVLLACGGNDADKDAVPTDADTDTDTDADTDTDTDADTDSDADTDADADVHTGQHSTAWTGPGVRGTFTFRSSLSGNPLLGVACEADGAVSTSNAAGVARMVLPEEAEVTVTCEDGIHLPHAQALRTGTTSGWDVEVELVTEGEMRTLVTALGIGIPQAGKGLVGITVLGADLAPLVGASVAIDRPSSGSMVSDLTQGLLFAEGATLPPKTYGRVLFANVDPGPAVITITPPGGEICATWPGDEPISGLEVVASSVAAALYVCR